MRFWENCRFLWMTLCALPITLLLWCFRGPMITEGETVQMLVPAAKDRRGRDKIDFTTILVVFVIIMAFSTHASIAQSARLHPLGFPERSTVMSRPEQREASRVRFAVLVALLLAVGLYFYLREGIMDAVSSQLH